MTNRTFTYDEYADKVRTKVFSELTDKDKALYKTICSEFATNNKLPADFDFFTYATHLAPSFDVWKPFIIKLRALGRFFTLMPVIEGKIDQTVVENTLNRALIMGRCVTPAISKLILTAVMKQSIPDKTTRNERCNKFLDECANE